MKSEQGKPRNAALDASDPRILPEGIKDGEVHLHERPKYDHHLEWLTSVTTHRPKRGAGGDGTALVQRLPDGACGDEPIRAIRRALL